MTSVDGTAVGFAVGFVGLGHMGHPMARNLAEAGFTLSVFDLRGDVASGFAKEFGARAADDPRRSVPRLRRGDHDAAERQRGPRRGHRGGSPAYRTVPAGCWST